MMKKISVSSPEVLVEKGLHSVYNELVTLQLDIEEIVNMFESTLSVYLLPEEPIKEVKPEVKVESIAVSEFRNQLTNIRSHNERFRRILRRLDL